MYAWGKKGKMLVFTGVYVCVRAKLTLVSFFFFAPFPYMDFLKDLREQKEVSTSPTQS